METMENDCSESDEIMEDDCSESDEGRRDLLLGRTLTEVFSRVPIEERLKTIPLVCKAWREVSYDPACWRTVEMAGYMEKRADQDFWWEESEECEVEMEALIKAVVDRGRGALTELRTGHCSDVAAVHIANNCPNLSVLSVANSASITDTSAIALALKCPNLTSLDVSDCYNISSSALEAFARTCPSLTRLARNMRKSAHHKFVPRTSGCPLPGGNEEAITIATHMSTLRHLEMVNCSLTDQGVLCIAQNCRQLESLNLANCRQVSAAAIEKVGTSCTNLKTFVKPIIPRMYVQRQFIGETWD